MVVSETLLAEPLENPLTPISLVSRKPAWSSPVPVLEEPQEDGLDEFRNEEGFIQLRRVRELLDLENPLQLTTTVDAYSEWLLDDLGLLMKKSVVSHGSTIDSFRVSKARKRGNDMDAFRVSRKMKNLKDVILPYTWDKINPFYLPSQFDGTDLTATRALYITGTLDPRLVDGSAKYGWLYLDYWFNLFMTKLRQALGTKHSYADGHGKIHHYVQHEKIRMFRSWESTKKGGAHFHAILLFEGFSWPTFIDKKGCARLVDRDIIRKCWPYGFCDVIALTPGTTEQGIEDVLWYVGKSKSEYDYRLVGSWPKKRLLTLSLMWYFRKRSFSISRSLLENDDSVNDLIAPTSITQITEESVFWEFIGLVHRKYTELAREDWAKEYPEPPDWLDRCWKPREGAWYQVVAPVVHPFTCRPVWGT